MHQAQTFQCRCAAPLTWHKLKPLTEAWLPGRKLQHQSPRPRLMPLARVRPPCRSGRVTTDLSTLQGAGFPAPCQRRCLGQLHPSRHPSCNNFLCRFLHRRFGHLRDGVGSGATWFRSWHHDAAAVWRKNCEAVSPQSPRHRMCLCSNWGWLGSIMWSQTTFHDTLICSKKA